MPAFDLDTLLLPLDDAQSAGPDLEYDGEFLELERMAAPVAERAVGDSVKEAREPEWEKVAGVAVALLGRSKDLRIAVILLRAWTRTAGLAGWAAGLELIHRLLLDFWINIHPAPDPAEENDPTARANAIAAICDARGALGYFRQAPVVSSPRMGHFNLRDLRIATGTLKIERGPGSVANAPNIIDIEACCLDCQETELIEALDHTERATGHAESMAWMLGERLGLAAPDLLVLLQDVRDLRTFLADQVAKRCPQRAPEQTADETGLESRPVTAVPGQIESPQDVSRALDRICDYYARHEPSSPLPLLLRRAQRLIGMDFHALLKDLAPNGINELRVLAGSLDDD